MKNSKINIIITIVISLFCSILFAQENSISPLFALSKNTSNMPNTLCSVNQLSGEYIDIEDFSTENIVGNNYTISTLAISNVDIMYVLNNNNNFSVYHIPYFFGPNYNGEQNEISVSSHVSDFDYHHQSTLIYSYDLIGQTLNTIIPFSGNIQNTFNIPFNVDASSFSIKTNNEYVILNGVENNIPKILFYHITNNTQSVIELSNYQKIKIVSQHHLDDIFAIATDDQHKNWILKINPETENITVISTLPSCSDCNTETYDYDKNGLSLDWENNQLLGVLKQTKNAIDSYFLLTIDLDNGEIINFSTLNNKTSNLYFNKTSSDLVFPGDANHDGIVNLLDVFSIGLKYSYNTTARFTQGNQWIGQHAFNTGVIKQGADIKHADCNGDGQINSLDIEAIKENYSYIHNSNKLSEAFGTDCDYPLAISFPAVVTEGEAAQINIKLGEVLDTVTAVYALRFFLNYDKNFVQPNTMKTIALDSWFGTDGGTFIRTHNDDWALGRIDISITGINLMNRSGGGDIITAAWTMEDHVVPIANPSEQMGFSISNITLINYAEDTLETCGQDTTITVVHKDNVSIKTVNNNLIEIYPNPAHSFIKVISDEKIDRVEIYSKTGQVVKTSFLKNEYGINVSNIARGIYLLKIYTQDGFYIEKILLN